MASGLYIHVPFCRSKCPYCGFYSIPSVLPVPAWSSAIEKEILLYRGRFGRFDTVYLGGGTPTFLDDPTLSRLTNHVFTHLVIDPNAEFTIEANPCDLSREKARRLRDLGINRVNLGVQSFDDRTLAFLGRRHTGADAEKALKRLRRVGFDNVGVDLIYGLPGQTQDGWKETLDRALAYQPEHISCYELTLEKGTVFERRHAEGSLRPVNEEEGRACFLAAARILGSAGYLHYEVSNYARTEAHCSRHNRKYWEHVPYLGLGPSAHSFDGRDRWWNVRSIRRYASLLDAGLAPVEGRETLTAEQMRLESLALGFRTRRGVDLKEVASASQSAPLLSRLEDAGLLTIVDERVIPTEEGFLVADQLSAAFS